VFTEKPTINGGPPGESPHELVADLNWMLKRILNVYKDRYAEWFGKVDRLRKLAEKIVGTGDKHY